VLLKSSEQIKIATGQWIMREVQISKTHKAFRFCQIWKWLLYEIIVYFCFYQRKWL